MTISYQKSGFVLGICLGTIWLFCFGCLKERKQEGTKTKTSVLTQNIKLHAFSDSVKLDTFKLTVMGSSVMQSKTTFEIISFDGKTIHSDTFDTKLLVNYAINLGSEAGLPTADDEMKYIERRLKFFFHPENFHQPAIDTIETFDEADNTEYWHEIKADRKAVSFTYLVGEENSISIAYSKRLKKAVIFWNCC